MKPLLLQLLTMLLALARTPADSDTIETQKENIRLKKDEINTTQGDSDIASPEVVELIDDLAEVLAAAEPNSEHAEELEVEAAEAPDAEAEADPDAPDPDEEPEPEPAPKKKKRS